MYSISDNSASTKFFTPKVYDSNSVSDVQQLLDDLDLIVATGGGDFPEYGMNGIIRVFDASTVSDTFAPNHILLFTDASTKDYDKRFEVEGKLEPPTLCDGTNTPHTFLHGFLPNNLVQSCGTLTLEQCYLTFGRAYMELIRASCGILVSRLTEGAFEDFISEYNMRYMTSYSEESCKEDLKRKRSVLIGKTTIIHNSTLLTPFGDRLHYCKYERVSELARRLTLLVTPQDDSVTFTVIPPTAEEGKVSRSPVSATVTQVVSFDDPEPGRYTVCANEAFELDARIENDFPFSVEFFNPTSDTPYLLTLPPPGCPVNVTIFSADINKLSLTGNHYLELVSTTGSVIGRIALVHSGCSSRYIRGASSLNLSNEAFDVRFSGVSKLGYTFEANLLRRYTAPLPPMQLRTTTAPTQVARGETAVYSFHLTTRTYPGCDLRLPISIEAHTDMVGITLSADSGGIFTGSYTFNVRVTVNGDAPIRSGTMAVRIKDSRGKIIIESTARIGVGVSTIDVLSYEATTYFT